MATLANIRRATCDICDRPVMPEFAAMRLGTCAKCWVEVMLDREHSDGQHEDSKDPGCPSCKQELTDIFGDLELLSQRIQS